MESCVNDAAVDTRSIKATVGVLALVGAPAAGAAAMMAASPFGALTALALSAAAGFAAALELFESDRHRRGRNAGRGTLAAGWLGLAAMQLNLPLRHLTGLRLLTRARLGAGAALRVGRSQTHRERMSPGLVAALVLALTARVVMWSGSTAAATAMGVGCAAELFGTGGLCLGEAFTSRPLTASAAVGLSAPAAIQMA